MARILIVDDSSVMRKNLNTIFTENGHEVVGEAVDGSQAILLYSELKPDLVTMDITMPRISGVEAVEAIIKEDSDAKIIMVSALNQKQMVFEALKRGAKHYVIKPIDPNKLIGIVDAMLEEISKISEIKKEDLDEKPGFIITNVNSEFVVSFNENLGLKDKKALDTVINGLLFITPLKVMFDFAELQNVSELVLEFLKNTGDSIIRASGQLKFRCMDETILEYFRGENK